MGPLQARRNATRRCAVQRQLGRTFAALGRPDEAIPHYQAALRLDPDFADAECDLGVALGGVNRATEAVEHFRRALASSRTAETHFDFASALVRLGSMDEAAAQFAEAARLEPGNAGPSSTSVSRSPEPEDWVRHWNTSGAALSLIRTCGRALQSRACPGPVGRPEEAMAQFQEALQLRPDYAEAHYGLGSALITLRRLPRRATISRRRSGSIRISTCP